MKILVNMLSARRGGSLIFINNLLPVLALLDSTINYYVIAPEGNFPQAWANSHSNIHNLSYTGKSQKSFSRIWFEHYRIPQIARSGNYSWYFQVDDTLPPLIYITGVKTISIFHASIQLLLPNDLGDNYLKVVYWQALKSLALRYATLPITVSHCAKGELCRGQEQVFKKIQVIYHGINKDLFIPKQQNKNSLPSGFPNKYILSVSTRNPHKNYYRLIQAYHLFIKNTNAVEHLVLVGSSVWLSEEERIRDYIREYGLEQKVHIFDAIDNNLLPEIYRCATAYVYPSLFDSFGMTPMEAMACGTPCAVSQMSALPETCGDAAEYFNPLDIQNIAVALETVVCNEERRTDLIELGYKHINRYSWEEAARAYHKLLTTETLPTWNV